MDPNDRLPWASQSLSLSERHSGYTAIQLSVAGRSTQVFLVLLGTAAGCLGIPVFAAVTVILLCSFHFMHRFVTEESSRIDQLQCGPVQWKGQNEAGLHEFAVLIDGSALHRPLPIHLRLTCDGFEEIHTLV